MHFSTLLPIVRVALLRSSWRSCFMMAALFIMRATAIHLLRLLFLCTLRFSSIPTDKKSDLYAPTSNTCIFTPIENWTHVYMNLFTRNSPYYHILKYLLFLLKHPVYTIKLKFQYHSTWNLTSQTDVLTFVLLCFLRYPWAWRLCVETCSSNLKLHTVCNPVMCFCWWVWLGVGIMGGVNEINPQVMLIQWNLPKPDPLYTGNLDKRKINFGTELFPM